MQTELNRHRSAKEQRFKQEAIITVTVLVLCAVLIRVFVVCNFTFLAHPELSPGYNLGAVFGDGFDEFRVGGIYVPEALLTLLNIFTLACIFLHFTPNAAIYRGVLFLIPIGYIATICILAITEAWPPIDAPTGIFYSLFGGLFIHTCFFFPLLAAEIIAASVLAIHGRRILAKRIGLHLLSLGAAIAMFWFDFYLYMD